MSQHSSLKSGGGDSKHRSVLKRYEKLKHLVKKDEWNAEKDSVYKIKKVKQVKFKVKKQAGPKEEKEGAEGGKTGQAATPPAPKK